MIARVKSFSEITKNSNGVLFSIKRFSDIIHKMCHGVKSGVARSETELPFAKNIVSFKKKEKSFSYYFLKDFRKSIL